MMTKRKNKIPKFKKIERIGIFIKPITNTTRIHHGIYNI